jgi:hypothetical protein
MIPLLKDPFFGAMAVCIMFGLSFACVLTMFVMQALHTIFYGISMDPAVEPIAAREAGREGGGKRSNE